MKTLTLLGLVFSLSAFAQLERPAATALCEGIDISVINSQIKLKFPKRSCVMKLDNATISRRMPLEKITYYVVPEGCNGRAKGEQGFDQGPLKDRGFIEIGKSGEGKLHLLKDEKPFACQFDVKSWKKLEELAKKNRP